MSTTAPYSLPPSKETNGQPVTVEDNIAKALAQTAGMTLAQKFEWFFVQVMPHGPMDYKYKGNYQTYNNSPAAQDFGNFNYGVVGTALGIPKEILDRFAGYAQVAADVLINQKIPNAPWGSDFGDNPGDQAKINEGITLSMVRCCVIHRLGVCQSWRLLGGDEELNTVGDLKDILFSFSAFLSAANNTVANFGMAGLNTVFNTFGLYNTGATIIESILGAFTNTVALPYMQMLINLKPEKYLDALRKIVDPNAGNTSADTFVENAKELFYGQGGLE